MRNKFGVWLAAGVAIDTGIGVALANIPDGVGRGSGRYIDGINAKKIFEKINLQNEKNIFTYNLHLSTGNTICTGDTSACCR
jgi:hypothetical protein